MAQGIRRQARAYALQVLYAADVGEHEDLPTTAHNTWETFELELPAEARQFAETLVGYVNRDRAGIDQRIQQTSKNWRVERMSRVDRNILRLAVAELMAGGDISPKVVINEAVELAKRFGAEEAPAFVNGILDRIAQDLATGAGQS